MAANPNTNFTAGQVLTADQANRWPRGVMADPVKRTTSQATITTEVALTGMTLTFTAVANRLYKFTWHEPNIDALGNVASTFQGRVRLTNISGTILQHNFVATGNVGQNATTMTLVGYFTPSAGSTTIICTGASSPASSTISRTATSQAIFMVEDIGPA
jgi:hypothetical protein